MAAPTLKLLVLLASALGCAAGASLRSAYCPDGCQCVWLDLVCDDAGLGAVPSGDNWSYVTTLFLNSNNISALPDDAFAPYPKLASAFLDDNALRVLDLRVFAPAQWLSELRLARNQIETIVPTGYHPGELETLDLSFKQRRALETLDLAYTQLGSLETLDLSYNRLRVLDPHVFDSAQSLRYLILDGNPLVLPASGLLVHLTLAFLSLSGVDGSGLSPHTLAYLPNLDTIRLNACDVRNLSEALAWAPSLYTVELQDNAITTLPADVFLPKVRLDSLSLDGNPLEKIELAALDALRDGATFSIVDTKIACSCGYEDVWNWTQAHAVQLKATCNSAPPCSFENSTTV